ncbi:WD40 repeat-like protein, partial [Dendrothele bispora CBS 962.96]
IWDSHTGQPVGQPLHGHTDRVWSVAYSPDSRHIVSGSYDKTIRIWDSQTGQPPVGHPLQGHTHWVTSVAYSPDSRHIVSGSFDKTVRIWESQTGQPVNQPLQGHTDAVWSSDLVKQDVSYVHSPPNYLCDIDSEGWLYSSQSPSDLILWLPHPLKDPFQHDVRQVLTIPPDAENSAIKVDWCNFAFGEKWTDTWADIC